MRLGYIILFSAFLFSSCISSKKSTSQRNNKVSTSNRNSSKQDGLSYETAVFITEKSEMTGPAAEYKWIKEHYTNYQVLGQALVNYKDKPYDIITIRFEDNKELKLYFDISNYFGKF